MCGGHTGHGPKTSIPRTLHALLQPDHVHGDLEDGGQQRERATPFGAECHAPIDHLTDQVLDPAAVVLHRQVEPLLLVRHILALPLGDDLRRADVRLVAQAILPWLDV